MAPKMRTGPVRVISPVPYSISDIVLEGDDSPKSKVNVDLNRLSNVLMQYDDIMGVRLRCLNNLKIDKTEVNILREKYIIAEGITKEEALKRVREALNGWNAETNTFLLKLPSKGTDAYVFDEVLQQVCLARDKEKEYHCAPDKALRIYHLMGVIETLLKDNIVLRVRSIYYLYPHLHQPELKPKDQMKLIDGTVGDICQMLLVTRESLNLYASPTGLITGPLLLKSDGKLIVDCNLGGSSGCLIPSDSVLIDEIHPTGLVEYVLLLEKDTVFDYLSDHEFHKRNNCVLVTGRGQADMATRILLRKLRDSLEVICYCLVDANPGGVQIFSTYRFGSEEKAHENLFMTVSDLEFIGLNLDDIPAEKWTPFSDYDRSLLSGLQARKYVDRVVNLRANLMSMKNEQMKADIEMLMCDENIEEYICGQIKELCGSE